MRDQPPLAGVGTSAAGRKSQIPLATSIDQHVVLQRGQVEEDSKAAGQDISQGSSGSSSPEPSSGSTSSTSAPKPFKKRYLAAEKAKISGESSESRKSACEALLKLAEGESTNSDNSVSTMSSSTSTTSTTVVCNGNSKTNPYDKVKETAQFSVLRQAGKKYRYPSESPILI